MVVGLFVAQAVTFLFAMFVCRIIIYLADVLHNVYAPLLIDPGRYVVDLVWFVSVTAFIHCQYVNK